MEIKFLSPAEVESIYGISRRSLAYWRSSKTGPPYYKVGRSIRYSVPEMDQWMSKYKVKPMKEGIT